MRVHSLNMVRYGAFDGRSIQFGPGLTIVVGVNEAGKSTALEALSDLLWEIPRSSSQAYLYGRPALAIEGVLSVSGGPELRVVRRSTGLTYADTGQDVDSTWRGDGDSRERWRQSFGLSHETLRAGGRALCEGEGDLAELVFTARSGSAIRRLLDNINQEADKLYKENRGNKNVQVRRAAANYHEAMDKVKRATTPMRDVDTVVRDLGQTDRELEQARKRLSDARLAAESQQARLRVFPHAQELAEHRARAAALRDVGPFFLEEHRKIWTAATKRLHDADSASAKLKNKLAELRGQRSALVIDHDIVNDAELLQGLRLECEARLAEGSRSAELQTDANEAAREVAALLAELVGPGDSRSAAVLLTSLHVPADRVEQLDTLAAKITASETRLRQHAEAHEGAVKRLAAATVQSENVDLDALNAVREVRDEILSVGSAAELQREAISAHAEALRTRDECLARAGLPAGAAPERVPTADSLRQAGDALTTKRAELDGLKKQLEQTEQHVNAARETLADANDEDIPSLIDLQDARVDRDKAVNELIAAWMRQIPASEAPGLPGQVERTMRSADIVADRLRTHAESVARRAELEKALAGHESHADILAKRVQGATEEMADAEHAWSSLWQNVTGPAPTTSAAADVRRCLEDALAAERDAAAAQVCIDGLREQVDKQEASLAAALDRAGRSRPGADLDSLLAASSKLLADADAEREARAIADELRKVVEDTKRESTTSQQKHDENMAEWRQTLRSAVITDDLDAAGWEKRRDILNQAAQRQQDAKRIGEEARRLKIKYDTFVSKVTALARRHQPTGSDLATIIDTLSARLDEAQSAQAQAREMDRHLEAAAAELDNVTADLKGAHEQLDALCANLGLSEVSELDGAAERGEKHADLIKEIDRLTGLIRAAIPDADVDAVVAELAATNRETLEAADSETNTEQAEAEEHLAELQTRRGELQQRQRDLDSGTGAAELLASAQEHLTTLREYVERYFAAHIQRIVLRAELEAYERKHASPLLDEAGRILEGLTGGRYVALRAVHHPYNRSLMVVGADEDLRGPAALSEGTIDQTFLALRLAGIASLQDERLTRGLPTLPVVLDDVLMTFDDGRAEAALRVMAELARRWQIIVFSHHTHLADLSHSLPEDNITVSRLDRPALIQGTRQADDIRDRARTAVIAEPADSRSAPKKASTVESVHEKDAPAPGEIRVWARANGFVLGDRGRIPADVMEAYAHAHG